MRAIVWICLAILAAAFGLTMVFLYPFQHPLYQELGGAAVVIVPILMLQPFCALWMLYQAVRHEAKPLFYILLVFFVPFAYVWYYVERFRPRKQARASIG